MFKGYIKKSDFDKIPLKKSQEDFHHFSYTTQSLDQPVSANYTALGQMESGLDEGWDQQPSEIVRPDEQEYEQGYDGGSQHSLTAGMNMNHQCEGYMTGYGDSQIGAYDSASGGYGGMQTASGYDQPSGVYAGMPTSTGYDQASGGYAGIQTATGYDQAPGQYDQAAGGYQQSEYGTSSYAADGMGGGYGGVDGDLSGYQSANEQENVGVQQDPNPVIVRKKFPGPCAKYMQKICVRYLQPPQLPPPGPLIIKEVRDPQPPPQPPLCIKQRMPPPSTPPLLILRERPPKRPPVEPSKVICKRIPPPPPPKRQVIIERFPKPAQKPRDILIERWLPYKPQEKRKVIYQRAPPIQQNKGTKNLIIMYEGCTQIERVFRKLGVQQANPEQYLQQYGNELLDASELENRARSAGVREDISPPALGQQYQQYALDSSMGANNDISSGYGAYGSTGADGYYPQSTGAGGFEQGSQPYLDSGYGATGAGYRQEQPMLGASASEQYGPAAYGNEAGMSSQLPSGC